MREASTPSQEHRPETDISVILPIHNEKENIAPLLEEIEHALAESRFEVIAVDDGSGDGSGRLLAELAEGRPWLRVISFRGNYGQSAAFDAGFRHAVGRIVVTMDADGQNDPADIPRMIEHMEREDLDFVAGDRAIRRDSALVRTMPSKIANWIIRRVTGTKIRDLGCSLKVYRREIAQELRLYGEMHRFIAVLVESMGARTGQVTVSHRPRASGKSNYGLSRTIKVLLDLLTVWFMRGYHTKPIYVFGGIGALLFLGASVLSGYVLYEKLWLPEHVFVHRNPLFILSMVMAIVAVQFMGLGLLAEIIVRTYFESQQKPSYLIRSTTHEPDTAGRR
jgi:glycosyltransferase involved in cell wall biosynthesis